MFFAFSKFFWTLFMPVNLLCLLALVGFLVRLKWKKTGRRMILAATGGILILGFLPIGPLTVGWLENRYRPPAQLPDKVDGIIVLGGMHEGYTINGQRTFSVNNQIDRLYCFINLGYRYPQAKMVFSGGAGNIMRPGENESDFAKSTLALSRFPLDRVTFENRSRNTYENALYTKELIKPKFGEHWVIITSAYHMPRAMGVFAKVGWPVNFYQCDPKTDSPYSLKGQLPNVADNLSMVNLAAKELIGSTIYYLTGKSAFIIPSKRESHTNADTSTYQPGSL